MSIYAYEVLTHPKRRTIDNSMTLAPLLPPLSKRQEQLLRYIYGFYEQHRYYPTHRECADALKLNSSHVAGYLEPLVKKGYLERRSGVAHRNFLLTELGLEKLVRLGVGTNNQLNLPATA